MSRLLAMTMAALACGLADPAAARAQPPREPLSPFVVDVRGALPFLGQSPETAASLGIAPGSLPGKGLGVGAGFHVYPIRRRSWAIGVGAEWLRVRSSATIATGEAEPAGPTIARRFEGFSGQISLNFGHRDGWSYLSGGAGPLAFDTWNDADSPDGVRAMTLNYGGGARWFTRPRLAVGFDVRLYATRPSTPTAIVGARGRQTMMVISVGISVR